MSNVKQAMIMAAGFGKRMLPLTESMPKPMVDINGKSFIENILEKLYNENIARVIINTHYLAETLEKYICSLEIYKKLDIFFIHEKEILDSGGGVVNALPLFENKPFFRINSDIFWENNSILKLLDENYDEDIDALIGVIDKKLLIGYSGGGDFNLINNKLLKLDEKEKQYAFLGIGIFSPRLFYGQEVRKFTLFGDYIFKFKKDENNILENIYGLNYEEKIYHIDTVENLANFKKHYKI